MTAIDILAVDPGPHTGLAMHGDEGYSTIMYEGEHVLNEVLSAVWELRPKLVVVERFATAGRISVDGLFTVNMVGAIEGTVWALRRSLLSLTVMVRMTPSSRRAFQTEAKKMNVAVGPHELDALMHLLSYEHRISHGYV